MARSATRPTTSRARGGRASALLRVAGVLLVAAAIALAMAPIDPAWIDRVYPRGWYAFLQPIVTSISSLLPVALLDIWVVLAAIVVVWTLWRVWRPSTGTRIRAAGRALVRGAAAASVVYLLFLLCWGLNYRRLPITHGFDFDRARVTAREVEAASVRAVTELNALHQGAHADLRSSPTMAAMRVRLAPAFAAAQRALGQQHLATAGRPKISMLSPFFRWATVDGMVNPLGLEVIVNPDVLPVEQPFVIAHEWGHLAGWARESEASYVGWLTCRAGDHAARYSGWLSLYWHLRRDLRRDRLTPPSTARLAPGRGGIWQPSPRVWRARSRWCSRRAGVPTTSS